VSAARLTIERTGTALLVAVTLVVFVVVSASLLLQLAADDLYAAIDQAQGRPLQHPRGEPGTWLSSRLAGDLAADDISGRRARADALNYRGDRVREAAGVGALVGLLIAVLTARPGRVATRGRGTTSPDANTISNGMT
jgi:hypothetical protein